MAQSKYYYVYRSAVTGLYVTKEVHDADPKHHVRERRLRQPT